MRTRPQAIDNPSSPLPVLENFTPIRVGCLRWYAGHRRDLPWRRTRDAYAIWIAETMLQQTQVKTVLPYYRRFLRTFPRLRSLARASRRRVLAEWSGLGYYRRAENLLKAARRIVREHGGVLPRDFAALRSLPGIGTYTAGALMSIAFNRPYPALDGNARRVLARVFNLREEGDLQTIAQRLVDGPNPGQFNQALMELGSRVCRAREPACPICPLALHCVARRAGKLASSGARAHRSQLYAVDWPMLLLQQQGRILLRRRPNDGLLGGLWELPGGERTESESRGAALRRQLDGLAKHLHTLIEIGELRHNITNYRIRAPIYRGAIRGKVPPAPSNWRWVPIASLKRYPMSSLTVKALKLLCDP